VKLKTLKGSLNATKWKRLFIARRQGLYINGSGQPANRLKQKNVPNKVLVRLLMKKQWVVRAAVLHCRFMG
jgi:hypothetical protein